MGKNVIGRKLSMDLKFIIAINLTNQGRDDQVMSRDSTATTTSKNTDEGVSKNISYHGYAFEGVVNEGGDDAVVG